MALLAFKKTSSPTHTLPPIRKDAVLVGGDKVVGALLSQIKFWYEPNSITGKSKMRVKHDGCFWIAKTRTEWMTETGLTLKQYKRAIFVLKHRGIVSVKVFKFAGITMGHLRLHADVFQALLEGSIPLCPKGPSGCSLWDHPYTETTTETTHTDLAKEPPEQKTDLEGETVRAEEVIKGKEKASGFSLVGRWQSGKALHYGGFQHPLTLKEKGQLSSLKKILGDADGKQVIDYVLANWITFAARAGAAAGTSYPQEPSIGFLYKHYGVAMSLLTPEVKSPVVQLIAPAPTLPVVSQSQEVAHKLSSEELADMLDGLSKL